MKPNYQRAAWPYLWVLVCLFVLSVTAPRQWERRVHPIPLSDALAARPHLQPGPSAGQVRPQDSAESATVSEAGGIAAKTVSLLAEPAEPADVEAVEPVIVEPPPAVASRVEVPADVEIAHLPAAPQAIPDVPLPAPMPLDDDAHLNAGDAGRGWPLPTSLLDQLKSLAARRESAAWADDVTRQIKRIPEVPDWDAAERKAFLTRLRTAASAGASLASSLRDPALAAEVARARYALVRRLDVWDPLSAVEVRGPMPAQARADQMAVCLANLRELQGKGAAGTAWREYLMLDRLERLSAENRLRTEAERRAVARRILDRLSRRHLSPSQRKFVDDGALAALNSELLRWATEPVDSARLLSHLEAYERSGAASDAGRLARDCRWLEGSADPEAQQLCKQIATHYRNANIRLAVSGEFLNRLVPKPDAMEAPVYDRIAGAEVRGRSTTFTDLFVRLVPDERRVRLGLEASGVVASNTASTSGPATFFSTGQSSFIVRKLFVYGPHGLHVWPAIAEADSFYNHLRSLETDFDGLPLVSSLVRGYAQSQHQEAQPQARREIEFKVATRAKSQLDQEIQARLVKAQENLRQKVLLPLEGLALEPQPVDMQTTADRATMRFRIAGEEQLAAHTPRPRAPSDSQLSLQVHQSALNNALERLELDGREFTLPELFQWIGKKCRRPGSNIPDDLPEDVHIRFAGKDSVRLRCEDGRIEVAISVDELRQGRTVFRDFTVRAFYRAEPHAMRVRFIRDSTIFLSGESLGSRAQIGLRGVFSKVLSRNRPWTVVDEKIAADPRLRGLQVTQLVVEEGWIGLAYGPQRPAANVARRPKP